MHRDPDEDREIREAVCPDVAWRVSVDRERDPSLIGNVIEDVEVDLIIVLKFDSPLYVNERDPIFNSSCE
jgi:hypothetical protein